MWKSDFALDPHLTHQIVFNLIYITCQKMMTMGVVKRKDWDNTIQAEDPIDKRILRPRLLETEIV